MSSSPIKFGTSGWRGLIADDFTFANVRLAVNAIAGHINDHQEEFHHPGRVRYAFLLRRVFAARRRYSPAASYSHAALRNFYAYARDRLRNYAPQTGWRYQLHRQPQSRAIPRPEIFHRRCGSRAARSDQRHRSARRKTGRKNGQLGNAARHKTTKGETVNLRDTYLKRLGELVRFDVLRKGKAKFVVDALHGCGAGYLDRVLADHGVSIQTMRTNRDCLFDGTGPDVSEENLAPLRKAVTESGATAGLATDCDADRFGIIDRDGTWVSPNHILALVYDYLVESRGWKMPAARSVATSQMVDAAARAHGQTAYQTPVGFKYIGQLIREDKIALGGEESAGLTIRGHVPEKDGILACLLVAEMLAARGGSLGEQIKALFKKLGREFWPVRENLRLSDEQKANTIKRVAVDAKTLLGRKVVSVDRTDGAKFVFDDGSWMLLRLSGTEPLLRLYVEADSPKATARLTGEATKWVLA